MVGVGAVLQIEGDRGGIFCIERANDALFTVLVGYASRQDQFQAGCIGQLGGVIERFAVVGVCACLKKEACNRWIARLATTTVQGREAAAAVAFFIGHRGVRI